MSEEKEHEGYWVYNMDGQSHFNTADMIVRVMKPVENEVKPKSEVYWHLDGKTMTTQEMVSEALSKELAIVNQRIDDLEALQRQHCEQLEELSKRLYAMEGKEASPFANIKTLAVKPDLMTSIERMHKSGYCIEDILHGIELAKLEIVWLEEES